MGSYDPLLLYLLGLEENEIELSFREIEAILQRPLPASARKYPAWWSNDPSHSLGRLLGKHDIKTARCSLAGETIVFRKAPEHETPDNAVVKTGSSNLTRLHPEALSPAAPNSRCWDVCLVSCVAVKRPGTHPARDLYASPLFVKSRTFAEKCSSRWYILSAKYGLVEPDRKIAGYDQTLKTMHRSERQLWADHVLKALRERLNPKESIVILAGNAYTENIVPELEKWGHPLDLPLHGLSIGRRLARLDELNHG